MKLKICIICLGFLTCFYGYSQESESGSIVSITMDQAVEMAINNNLGLRQTILNNEANRRAARTPWNVFIPAIDVGGGLVRPNRAQTITGLQPIIIGSPPYGVMPYSIELHRWFLSGSVNLGLSLNVGTFTGIKQTIEEYQAGRIAIEKARLQLERDVRKAYYQILLAKEYFELLGESFVNANRQVAMAEANFRGGLIPEVNVLQVRVARENLRPQIDEAENMYRMAMAAFALFLGLPYDVEFVLAPLPGDVEFIILEAQDLISRAAVNKPEIAELRRNLAALKARRTTLFYNFYTPTLSLAYSMDPAFGGDPMKGGWFNSELWNQQQGMFRITLGWRLNALFPFSREFQSYQAMNDALKMMDLGMALAVEGTKTEVYNIILQLEKTRTSALVQRMTIDLAERTLALSEIAYRNGLKQFIEVQGDELALRQARLGMAQQNYNYLMGLLDLEYAIGVTFGTLGGRNY